MSTFTKAEKEITLTKAIETKNFLDKTLVIKEWKNFVSLPYSQQRKIRNDWEKYLNDVKESITYGIVTEQKKALRHGDITRVKELAAELRAMKENGQLFFIDRPKSVDPFDFDYGAEVRAYKAIVAKIKELSTSSFSIEQQQDVWFAHQ